MKKRVVWAGCLLPLLWLASSGIAWAADAAPKIDSGDTAFVLIGAAMVLLMTPGPGVLLRRHGAAQERALHHHAFLYHHLPHFRAVGAVRLQHRLWPRQTAPDRKSGVAGLERCRRSAQPELRALPFPHLAYMAFQLMFAIITAALISGSFAERFRFPAFLIFTILWTTIVYDPLAHWVWGYGGWLNRLGVLDFAGGTVVHISSGVSGLVTALGLGQAPRVQAKSRCCRTTCRLLCWAPGCSGSAGSGLTPAAPWPPTAWLPTPLW